ncbi:hypothetical protein PLICRDRAFT_183303 [Plicaturopsis crispa FD-325 SS-3]|nr:hypothetical protein PLICRDRAFT_183303 [Plicaturopsis crispa FD-325 SS-3]
MRYTAMLAGVYPTQALSPVPYTAMPRAPAHSTQAASMAGWAAVSRAVHNSVAYGKTHLAMLSNASGAGALDSGGVDAALNPTRLRRRCTRREPRRGHVHEVWEEAGRSARERSRLGVSGVDRHNLCHVSMGWSSAARTKRMVEEEVGPSYGAPRRLVQSISRCGLARRPRKLYRFGRNHAPAEYEGVGRTECSQNHTSPRVRARL